MQEYFHSFQTGYFFLAGIHRLLTPPLLPIPATLFTKILSFERFLCPFVGFRGVESGTVRKYFKIFYPMAQHSGTKNGYWVKTNEHP